MSGSLQLGFSDYEQFYAKKKTRRQIFLDEMEATTPAVRKDVALLLTTAGASGDDQCGVTARRSSLM